MNLLSLNLVLSKLKINLVNQKNTKYFKKNYTGTLDFKPKTLNLFNFSKQIFAIK